MNNPVAQIGNVSQREVELPSGNVEITPMDEEELVSFVRSVITEAAGQDDSIAESRNNAFNYYMARPNGTELPGRSQVVDSSIQDSIEAVLSQIMPIFTAPDLAAFSAISAEDEEQAQIESLACNQVIFNYNPGYTIIYEAIKDALIQKNGIIKVYIDEDLDIRFEEYEDLSKMERTQVLQPQQQDQEIEILNEEETEREIGIDPFSGIVTEPRFNLSINRITARRKLKIEAIPPEQFLFQSDQTSINLKDCGFTGRRFIIRRYELIEMGFDPDLVNSLPATFVSTRSDDYVRDQFSAEAEHKTSQKQTDPVEVIDVDVRVDADGDGYAELRNIVISSNTLLSDRPINCVSYVAGTPFIMPHRFLGMSFYDKLRDLQNSKTATKRQYWDNLNMNNNRRIGVNVKAIIEPDSVLDSKPAGVIKCKVNPAEAIYPIPVDDIGPSCIQALDYLDRERTEKVGASLDMQSQQTQVSAETAHGVERLVSAREEMSAMIATTLGETLIQNLFLVVHKMLRENFPSPMSMKTPQGWQNTEPGKWLDRERVDINVAMSPGEKIRKAGLLNQTLNQQMQQIQAGEQGTLITNTQVFNTLSDLARTTGLGHPSRYWINPQSQQAQQAAQGKAQQQEEMKQKQEALEKSQQDLQVAIGQAEMLKAQNGTMKVQIDELNAVISAKDSSEELQFKYEKLYQDTANKLLEIGADVTAQTKAVSEIEASSGNTDNE